MVSSKGLGIWGRVWAWAWAWRARELPAVIFPPQLAAAELVVLVPPGVPVVRTQCILLYPSLDPSLSQFGEH